MLSLIQQTLNKRAVLQFCPCPMLGLCRRGYLALTQPADKNKLLQFNFADLNAEQRMYSDVVGESFVRNGHIYV